MFDSILVVCTGNICRSPIGERLLRQLLPGKRITSAGIYGLEGSPADVSAQDVAGRHGISLEGHRARKLTPQIMRESDLILVMEPAHLRFISDLAPEIRGKSLLLGNGWGRRTSPIPIVKVVKRSIMFSVCWAKPVRNGLIV